MMSKGWMAALAAVGVLVPAWAGDGSVPEISTDPKGFKASRLSGPMAGGREPNSDMLLVYSGQKWSDGNTEFSEETSLKSGSSRGLIV
jgi:hypothetical protein